jgi:hypothetical protein
MERKPLLLIDAIASGMYVHAQGGTRVDQDGLVHRIKNYDEHRTLWAFFCGTTFHGDAHVDRESLDPLTCVACFTRQPWFR